MSGSQIAADDYTITDAHVDCKRFFVLAFSVPNIKYEIVKVQNRMNLYQTSFRFTINSMNDRIVSFSSAGVNSHSCCS